MREKPLGCVLYILYMLIVNIVLMNMLIAIMSDVYMGISQSFHSEFMKVRATVIGDFLSIMEAEQRDTVKRKFRWIYVLKQDQHKDGSADDEEFQKQRLQESVNEFSKGVDALKQ